MSQPILYGASYSVYTQIISLVLIEKGISYQLQEIDIFSEEAIPDDYSSLHPFSKIPILEHAGYRLYETAAISRYIEEAFPEPALLPNDIKERGRVNQIISILDNYAYHSWVWQIYVEEDEEKIAKALPLAETGLSAIEKLMSGDSNFIRSELTLADLHAFPMIAYLIQKPEGKNLLDKHPRWDKWCDTMKKRPSVADLF